ncbi:MAG TPA: pseudouridine synthase [Gemmatimonadales bacterium]|nr:pseudouridine synthase [Gemmatimonadales bacterium]
MTGIRLARFLARAGVTSRRGAAELVAAGRVLVNGTPPLGPGDPIEPGRDEVTLDGRPLALTATIWLVLNKPPGYVTSRCGTPRSPSIFALLDAAPPALVAVGRLDVYSEGVLLFTTDGEAANRLMHPRWQVPRTYRVLVTGTVGTAEEAALARGVPLEDGVVRPDSWRFRPDRRGGELELVLREGRTRVVRRLAAALGLGVRRLVRTAYGPVRLGALGSGESRTLGDRELAELYEAIGLPQSLPSSR